MARKREIERAKKKLMAVTKDRDWVQSIGVGTIDGKLGLVMSVRPRTKPAASRLLNRLELNVPVRVRAVQKVRALTASSRPLTSKTKSIDALRDAARVRLSKTQS